MKRLDLLAERDLPVTVGRYTLVGLLGEGGMARVFRATMEGALGFKKPAAVKVVLPAGGEKGQNLRQQLVQEARLGGLLNHPNVVQTFDCGELEGFPYIAMELVEGVGLDDLVHEVGPLPPASALDIIVQVVRGLHHAHTAMHEGRPLAIIHRDVKPSNVLVREDGVVKVMDFGIAKVAMEDALSTATGMTKGTPSYMSPEQLAAEPMDARSDLFAVGALLHFTLTGRTLFTGSSLTEVMLRIIQVDETVRTQNVLTDADALVPGLGAVLSRLLVKARDARYPTAGLLEEDLVALRRRLPDDERALGRIVREHFTARLASARDKAASMSAKTPVGASPTPEPAAAGDPPGATRAFPAAAAGLAASDVLVAPHPSGVLPTPREVAAPTAKRPRAHGTQTRPAFRPDGVEDAPPPRPRRRPRSREGGRRGLLLALGAAGGVLAALLVVQLLPDDGPAATPSARVQAEVARPDAPTAAEAPPRDEDPAPTPTPRSAAVDPRVPPPAPPPRHVAARSPTPAPPTASAEDAATRPDRHERPGGRGRDEAPSDRDGGADAAASSKGEDATPHPPKGAVAAPDPTPAVVAPPPVVIPSGPPRLHAEHVPVKRATLGTTKPIVVTVDGPSDARVTMTFGPRGGPHQSVDLEPQGSGVWRGALTIDASASGGLEYWIVVKHPEATPRVIALGRQSAPYEVAVF